MDPLFVPEPSNRVRVILNTDAKNEADDQYAIVHAILTPLFELHGIIPAHFGDRRGPGSLRASHEEVLKVLDLIRSAGELRQRLRDNTAFFRTQMTEAGFDILPGEHPIVPVMVGEATMAARMAEVMLEKGVYVVSFSYPVVPQGKARIRTQVSAAHSRADLERAVKAFVETRQEIGN